MRRDDENSILKFLFNFFKIVGVFGFMFLVIYIILVSHNLNCTNKTFKDIRDFVKEKNECISYAPNITDNNIIQNITNCNFTAIEFLLEQNLNSFRNEMIIRDMNRHKIGSYIEKVNAGRDTYRYRYWDAEEEREFVIATIERRRFLNQNRYFLKKCIDDGHTYRFEENSIQFQDIKYELYKDDILIGVSSENIFSVCSPDISIADTNREPIAILSRNCRENLFNDFWLVVNFRPDLVDDYVIGFLGYITTLRNQ